MGEVDTVMVETVALVTMAAIAMRVEILMAETRVAKTITMGILMAKTVSMAKMETIRLEP